MKYRLVKIDHVRNNWYVVFCQVEGDRKDEHTVPNVLGWYYYPHNGLAGELTDRQAFRRLRDCMARAHRKEIADLTESYDKLMELKVKPT
jgi:hypothetical protein